MSEMGLTQTSSAIMATDTAVTASFYFGTPVKIIYWGSVSYVAHTVADSVLTASVVEADGTAAVPTGAAQGGVMTIPFATDAVNTGYYRQPAVELQVVPGERFDIVSDGGSTAGDSTVFVVYQPLPFQDWTRATTYPGSTQRPNTLSALTETTS